MACCLMPAPGVQATHPEIVGGVFDQRGAQAEQFFVAGSIAPRRWAAAVAELECWRSTVRIQQVEVEATYSTGTAISINERSAFMSYHWREEWQPTAAVSRRFEEIHKTVTRYPQSGIRSRPRTRGVNGSLPGLEMPRDIG